MTLLSPAAQSASLDNDYGANAGPNAPADLEVALFNGDPLLGGTELTGDGGYAAVSVPNDGATWPDAASGGAKTSAVISFPDPTAAWSDTATFFVLRDASTGDEWDSGVLADVIDVDEDEDGNLTVLSVATQLTVFYEDLGA